MANTVPKHYRWPEVGRAVQVQLGQETLPLPAKVLAHDVAGDTIVLTAPGGVGQGSVVADPGDRMTLAWVLPSGLARLSVAFLGRQNDPSASVSTWHVEPVSEVSVIERRRFPRVQARQRLALRLPDMEVLAGSLVDVSEGGIRCLVDTTTPAKLTSERVESVLRVPAGRIGVRGMATWARHHGDHVEVGIAFDRLRKQDAEAIRRHVAAALKATA